MKRITGLILTIVMLIVCGVALASDGEIRTPEMGIWKVRPYVDEFQLPTDIYYVTCDVIDGTFSNSATTNSDLTARILCCDFDGKDFIEIKLFEYGRYPVTNSYSRTKEYSVVVMDKDGQKTSMKGIISKNGGKSLGIYPQSAYVMNGNAEAIVAALKKGGTVRFSIKEEDGLDSYLFTIDDASGFDVAHTEWRKQ